MKGKHLYVTYGPKKQKRRTQRRKSRAKHDRKGKKEEMEVRKNEEGIKETKTNNN